MSHQMAITDLQCHEQLQEARRTRATAEILSWAPEGRRWAVLERDQLDPPMPCLVRVFDGPADDDASKSKFKLKYDDSETTRLASDIRETSRSLSIYVTKMRDILHSFVSALENVEVTVKKKLSLAEWILEWLKSLFRAITRIFATFCPAISALLHSADLKVQKTAFDVSTLRKAATTFCAADSGALLEHTILPCKD